MNNILNEVSSRIADDDAGPARDEAARLLLLL